MELLWGLSSAFLIVLAGLLSERGYKTFSLGVFLQGYVTLGVVTAVLAAPCATESAQPLTSGGAERLTPGAVCLISRLHCQYNPSSPRFVLGCFQATATRCMCGTERAREHSGEVS